jgi:plasmid replication initiation protein
MKLIQYHNDINKLKLGHFTENETDIFFSLLFKAKETKDDNIIMDFSELKSLANGDTHNDRFIKNILGLNVKLKSMSQTIEIEKGVFDTFSLFGTIRTDTNNKTIKVPIESNFRYLIENLMENYTELDLKQLVSLKGNYPKVLYRLLKQFESSKLYVVKIDDFRDLMGIPSTYAMFNIRQKVLKPCMEQLEEYFQGLKLEEIKIGRNVSCLKFKWNKKEKKIIKENPSSIKKKVVHGEKELEEHLKVESLREATIKDLKVEKIKITHIEYKELYIQYLEENKAIDTPYMRKTFDLANANKYIIVG